LQKSKRWRLRCERKLCKPRLDERKQTAKCASERHLICAKDKNALLKGALSTKKKHGVSKLCLRIIMPRCL
ncbi:hypothetical protein CLOM_g15033, partial [Closterium sp. NIES-68]